MAEPRLVFRVHAVRRMFERGIRETDVRHVLQTGHTIESYASDKPYPSRLVLGFVGDRPLHVVAADHRADNEIIVITVYEPEPVNWNETFRTRKPG